ncbi:C-terminal binding protein [uncultured Mesotoga sp.]|uniref:C-terminal binding protein n=1 Tax=uncultured Mesotoga sp. TaxID=1184400 RepID=UPI00259AC5DD|nr:C-terminal binding protein [uncultured Mesotoga sp.]MDK2944087.1 D-3-phosphoglycerate dehydrogenase / 2-oxoglutarate reductase [Mesotoga sp.]
MAKFKVYITDYDYPDIEIERKILRERADAEVVSLDTRDPEILKAELRDADAIITQYAPISPDVVEVMSKCMAVGRYGIGYDNVNVQACTEKGIMVINVPAYCEEEVSDTALAMMLSLNKKIRFYHSNLQKGIWDWKPGVPIHQFKRTVAGLIGFGSIARFTARKLKALGLRVLVYDPYVEEALLAECEVESADLDTLLRNSDAISINVPLTSRTKHMIGEAEFAKMKKTAVIINTARGAVIDEKALIRALQNKTIAGAGLDVFEFEPISPDNPLLHMDNVLATPHCGWYSEESKIEIRIKLATDMARVLNGEEPVGFVNKRELGGKQ